MAISDEGGRGHRAREDLTYSDIHSVALLWGMDGLLNSLKSNTLIYQDFNIGKQKFFHNPFT